MLNNLLNAGKNIAAAKSAAQAPTVPGNAINTTQTAKGIESLLVQGAQKMQAFGNDLQKRGAAQAQQPIKYQRGKAIPEIFSGNGSSLVTKGMKPASPMMSPEMRALGNA